MIHYYSYACPAIFMNKGEERMKLSKIFILFAVTLPISVLLRFWQISYTIDFETGFFKREQTVLGIVLLCLIGAACLALAVFSHFSFRTPEPKKRNIPEAAVSFLCAAVLGFELVKESFAGTVLSWQLALLSVTGFATVLLFLVHGISLIIDFPLPKLCYAVPTLYFLVRLICAFTSISSLALISDHLILMATYCTGLLFFLHVGKLQNGIDPDHTFRRLLGSGLCFILLSAVQSLPYFIFNSLLKKPYTHTTFTANLSLLVFGLFAAVMLFSAFCGKCSEETA